MPLFSNVKQIKLNNEVTSVPDNLTSSLLPIGFINGVLGFFNPLKSKLLKIIPHAHGEPITTLSILPDGSILSGSCNGVFKQWKDGECINTLVFNQFPCAYIHKVLVSPSAIFVIYEAPVHSYSVRTIHIGYLNNLTNTIWDNIWKSVSILEEVRYEQLINVTILTDHNKKLFFNSGKQVKLLNMESGSLKIFDMPSKWLFSYINKNIHYAFSNQEIVAVGNSFGQLKLLNTKQNQWETLSDSVDMSYEFKQLTSFSNDVLVSLSKFCLWTTVPMNKPETLIQFWDLNTNKCIHTLESSETINQIRALPNEILLTISNKNNIRFWDVSHLKLECQKTAASSQTKGFSI